MNFLRQEYFGNPFLSYLIFLFLILAGLVLKKFGAKMLARGLFKIFGRGGTREQEKDFFREIRKPFEALILFLALFIALQMITLPGYMTDHPVYHRVLYFINIFVKITVVLIFSWIGFKVIDYITGIMRARADKTSSKFDDQLVPFFKEMSKIIIVIFAFIFILGAIFRLNVTSLVAGLGIGGLAIALAAQDTLANLFGSFAIFLDKPFQVGDMIQVEDVIGEVTHVGFRSTRIRTLEKSFLTLPNRMLVDRKVDNLSLRTFRRVRFFVGVTYNTSEQQVKNIVTDIQQYIDEHVNTNQDGVVRFYEFGNSSLNILVQYFIDTMDWPTYLAIREEINFKILNIVEQHGSSFAFPTTTVHVQSESDNHKRK